MNAEVYVQEYRLSVIRYLLQLLFMDIENQVYKLLADALFENLQETAVRRFGFKHRLWEVIDLSQSFFMKSYKRIKEHARQILLAHYNVFYYTKR